MEILNIAGVLHSDRCFRRIYSSTQVLFNDRHRVWK